VKWIHEGVLYGDDGRYVGSHHNNDGGWWSVPAADRGKAEGARSRLDAIRKLEAVARRPRTPREGAGS
jgi:hypothetical protein